MSGALIAPLIIFGDAMEEILASGLAELGLAAPEGALGRFRAYYEYLTERNAVMDLTAITGEEDTVRLHFLDCCALLNAADFAGAEVIDVGSGAGFPGLPLKLMSPSSRVTLLDSQRKRADFTGECIERLGLEGIESVCMRAEETPREMRERYDIAVSRAVARLNLLLELCLPFVRSGGVFLAMKGPDCADEISEAANAAGQLGGRVRELRRYAIPGTDVSHAVVIVDKLSPTPPQYPRRWARMLKKPL